MLPCTKPDPAEPGGSWQNSLIWLILKWIWSLSSPLECAREPCLLSGETPPTPGLPGLPGFTTSLSGVPGEPQSSLHKASVPKATVPWAVKLILLLAPLPLQLSGGLPLPLPEGSLHFLRGFGSESELSQALSSSCLWPRLRQNVLCGFRDEITPVFCCNVLNRFSLGVGCTINS